MITMNAASEILQRKVSPVVVFCIRKAQGLFSYPVDFTTFKNHHPLFLKDFIEILLFPHLFTLKIPSALWNLKPHDP